MQPSDVKQCFDVTVGTGEADGLGPADTQLLDEVKHNGLGAFNVSFYQQKYGQGSDYGTGGATLYFLPSANAAMTAAKRVAPGAKSAGGAVEVRSNVVVEYSDAPVDPRQSQVVSNCLSGASAPQQTSG